jgi:hypothetical protein
MPIIPYVKQTWTDNVSSFSAARGAVIESGIHEVSLAPAVRVFHNANQSINHNTFTILAFNSERFDTAAGAAATHHDTVTNNSRLTCLYAGKYLITAHVGWDVSAVGVRIVRILLNGLTEIARNRTTAADNVTTHSVTTLYDLAVNDYVVVEVYQDRGSALNVATAANYTPEFMMVRVA